MYDFEHDVWTVVEPAPLRFRQMDVASLAVGQSLYTFGDVNVCCYMYTYGKGWRKVEHDGMMANGFGTLFLI